MRYFPEDIAVKLGLDQIFAMIFGYCKTDFAKEVLDGLAPSSNYDEILRRLDQANEMMNILGSGDPLPSRDFMDLKPFLLSIKLKGSFLQADEFQLLRIILKSLYDWTQYLKKHQEQYPEMSRLAIGFIADKSLIEAIEKVVDEHGKVRDSASPELKHIRSQLISKEKAVRTVISSVLKKALNAGFTEENSELTIREGRLVIPLKAEHKRRIEGFVHDESSSGQTVFLEPAEALQLNNEVRELFYEEKREIAKILTRLSDHLRESYDDLEKGAVFLGTLDLVHAKAIFSVAIQAVKPNLVRYPVIKLFQARHPLLFLTHNRSGKPTIPLTLELSRQTDQVLVISGPNAGGKSVALKTVGLVQAMLQHGLPVPVGEASEMGIFNQIFLDIGDAQSLENDLSTYSSHLTAMKYMVEHADDRTLFLIDEFGAGTEPQFGGAIAESILSELMAKKSFGIVTTHYLNLKEYADDHEGVINGAMKYDVAGLSPLFELEAGKRGSSFAFEIAQNIGLSMSLIDQAKSLVGGDQVDYEKLLNELEKERRAYEKLSERLEKEKKEVAEVRKDYESLKKMMEGEQKKILTQAREEARLMIAAANQKIEQTIREIKEVRAEKEKTRVLRESLKELSDSMTEKVVPVVKKGDHPGVGDWVMMKDQDLSGEVIALKGKQAKVRFGNIISFMDIDKLQKSRGDMARKSRNKRLGGISFSDRQASFKPELNVIGLRAEDAMVRVDQYIDEAILLGTNQVRITHGKGHGILRDMIRNHLKKHPMVEQMTDEHIDMGGNGVTLVYFR